MSEEKKQEEPKWKDEYYRNQITEYADKWYAELRCCDLANKILHMLHDIF